MGVLRNSISLSLTLSLVLGSLSAFAESPDLQSQMSPPPQSQKKPRVGVKPPQAQTRVVVDSTEYSYESKKFCGQAPDMMANLNKANNDKIERIESLKEDIADVKNSMVILNGVDKIKRTYEDALRDLVAKEAQSLKDQEKEKLQTLTKMKTVIRNGLTINALALLLKDGDLTQDSSFKINTICGKEANAKEPLCRSEMGFTQQVKSKIIGNPLDDMLENFKVAFRKIKTDNQATLTTEIKKIIDSIPDSLSPQAILSLLDRTSPGITSILATQTNKDQLVKCLSPLTSKDVLDACEKLLPSKKFVKPLEEEPNLSFMERMSRETTAAVEGIEGLSTVINEVAKRNIKSFGKQVSDYDSIGKGQVVNFSQKPGLKSGLILQMKELEEQRNSQSQKKLVKGDPIDIARNKAQLAGQRLTGASSLFYNPNFERDMTPQDVEQANAAEMTKAIETSQKWQKKCLDNIQDSDIDFCKKELETVSNKVDILKTEFKNKLSYLENELKNITVEDDNKFAKVETLKRFVAEKYLRKCADTSKLKTKKDNFQFDIKVDGTCFSGSHTLTTLDGLESDVNQIISKTKFAQNITGVSDSTGTFSKQEMSDFKDVCANNKDIASTYSDICREISGEKVARDAVEDKGEKTAKWVKYNDENWVTYDDKSPNGYSSVKKKSALSVFGAGVLPVLPQMLPMVIGNYMMQQNIDTLTNQALYQKQMLHNFDVYNSNPWMYNYNYFGTTSVPGYGNPFSTSTTNTGVNNTTGFGF